MGCFWGHRWSRWEVIEEGRAKYVIGGGECRYIIQRRHCSRCHKVEQEKVVS